MNDTILTAVISSVTTVMVAIIGVAQYRLSKRTKDIGEEVVNSHKGKSNLRDDIDILKRGILNIQRDIGGLREDQRQTRREVYDWSTYGKENRNRIHKLEETVRIKENE